MSSISKLIFTPNSYQKIIPGEELIEGLTALGWLGAPFLQGPANSFFVGDAFFTYITFMGCAPAMRLEPAAEGDENFCFIHLNTALAEPIFRGHHERFVPRCTQCRHGLGEWQTQLAAWQADHQVTFACPHCAAVLSIPDINWREKAAIGSTFIEVYSVYPHEGIPTPSFMSHLKNITGVDWKYFFEPG